MTSKACAFTVSSTASSASRGMILHPSNVAVATEVFTPDAAELAC